MILKKTAKENPKTKIRTLPNTENEEQSWVPNLRRK